MENKNIEELKPFHKNPRKITSEKFHLLGSSLEKYGDLSGIILNTLTGELIGGHQRVNFFKQNRDKIAVIVTERYDTVTPTGTRAYGHISFNGERFSYREVEWSPEMADGANIAANKIGGSFDYDILANQFDVDLLQDNGFEDNELGFANLENSDLTRDKDKLTDSMESYIGGNIKQITLFFKKEDFDAVVTRLDAVMQVKGFESHTDTVLHLLNFYENNTTA